MVNIVLAIAASFLGGIHVGKWSLKRQMKNSNTTHFKGIQNPTFCGCEECLNTRCSEK